MYLELGMVGLFLLIGIIISAFRNISKKLFSNPDDVSLHMAFLVMALLYNVTEAAFRPGLLMYFVFTLTVINVPLRTQQLQNYTGND
jgi:O-antigen ligase